jgi:general secretion pathway protein F/type IV pilus assembly protein PilC
MAMLYKMATSRLQRMVKRPQLAEMLNNIAIMLRAGLTLVAALQEAADSAELPNVRADIRDMVMSIQGGVSFSEAAGKYPHIFPATVLHLIRMGEETGQLDKMLAAASEHLKRVHSIISDTKQALLYPSIVFAVMGGGMIFWFYYVVPKIVGLFREMDVVLPTITVWLIALSNFMRTYMLSIAAGMVVLFFMIHAGRRSNRRFKRVLDGMLLKIPIAKTVVSASSLAFVTEYFAMLLNAGIDILQSFQIIIDSVGNEIYRDKLGHVRQSVSMGEGIADSFRKAGLFPPFVIRMIGVGEMSGSLTEQLDHLSEVYRNKLTILVSSLGKLLEPLVLVFAGLFFAIIIIALLLPVYDLVSQVSM